MTDIPASMVPWHGGDRAPDDWDGGEVLLRNGGTFIPRSRVVHGFRWTRRNAKSEHDIIAYAPTTRAVAPDEGGVTAAGVLRELIRENDEAPDFGMCDARDNDGDWYQSAHLAAWLVEARKVVASAAPSAPISERERGLVEALRPFGLAADDLDNAHGDNAYIWEAPAAMSVTAGHLRHARYLVASFDKGRG